jgi:diguanylate cyclase (GGDEF)-like protein/PAS domain S-box-containing protein
LLRDNPETAGIRTAVITGTYLDSVIRDCLKAGAVECMFKNEVEELFLARVAAMSRFIEVERNIEKQRESLAAILESVGEGVYGVDRDGCVTFANPATLKLLGINNAQSLIGELAHKVFHYQDDVKGMEKDRLLHAYAKGEELRSWETQFRHKSGKSIPVECTLYPLCLNGEQQGSVIAFRDISNQKMLEERLRWQATHDHLTELHNRRYFETQLEEEINQVQRSGMKSAVVYLDLDRFKYVNDIIGHDAGDQLLIDIGRTLTRQLRRNDILARIGGDEFSIILKNVDEALAVSLADECRESLAGLHVNHEEKNYHVQASVGVAMMGDEDMTSGDVLANSDIACHIAKQSGRNQTHVYEKINDGRSAMGTELGWSARLREALHNDGFVLYYQPILDMEFVDLNTLPAQDGLLWQQYLRSGSDSFSYEALIRMTSETGELFYPDAFIPTAERFGLMTDVDMWVVERAMQDILAAGHPKDEISLSLNLSGNTLDNDESAGRIKAILERYNVSPNALVFEITETSAIANIDQANRFISELTDIGCRFSLDDFGSGFCSFSQLKSLPSDFVKIDGQFVKSMARGSTDRAIVTAMNDVAHSLGRTTVAEFVESPEVIRLLKICGVDKVQGYYISQPLEALPHGNVVKLHPQRQMKYEAQ